MYKIAIVDDDEHWCLVIKSFFKKNFEVTTYERIPYALQELLNYDLVIVDFSIPPAGYYDRDIQGCDIIDFLKANSLNPPILVLASGFIGKHEIELGKKICPAADAFFSKDTGLDELLNQTQLLLASKKKVERTHQSQGTHEFKPLPTMAVVDDDRYWCSVLERFFRNHFEVFTFPTASEFLRQSFDFDLVLVDYSIPPDNPENYVESRELIRHLKRLQYPPLVILVSGYVSKNDSTLGKSISPEADAFFAKDAGLDALAQTIKNLMIYSK